MSANDLIKGLQEAVDHSKGISNSTRCRVVRVPDEIDVKSIREKLGVSQAEFALRFGFSLPTLRNWEQGRRFPDGPARVLLKVIDANPDAVNSALTG